MKIFPVSLVIFYNWTQNLELEVWTQVRTDDGPFHGLLEFPGGGVEIDETPEDAAIREIQEEVGLDLISSQMKLMGIYNNHFKNKNVLLYVYISPPFELLKSKGVWLKVEKQGMSSPYFGKIPGPNHRIIDDLFLHLLENSNAK